MEQIFAHSIELFEALHLLVVVLPRVSGKPFPELLIIRLAGFPELCILFPFYLDLYGGIRRKPFLHALGKFLQLPCAGQPFLSCSGTGLFAVR